MFGVDLWVSEHVTKEEVLGIGVAEVKLEKVPIARGTFPASQLLNDSCFHCYQIGSSLAGWDMSLDPIQGLTQLCLVPVFQLFKGCAAFLVQTLQPG